MPSALSPRVINALKADPRAVDLRALASHFYGLGIKTWELLSDDDKVCDVLANSFKVRAREISDHAHNPRGALGEGADFLRSLDEMERQGESCLLYILLPPPLFFFNCFPEARLMTAKIVFKAAHESAKLMKAFTASL